MDSNFPEDTGEGNEQILFDLHDLSTEQLARLGVAQLAYVKPVVMEGKPAFAIHAADGTPMAVADSCEVALAAIQQHDMVAARVH